MNEVEMSYDQQQGYYREILSNQAEAKKRDQMMYWVTFAILILVLITFGLQFV